MAHPQLDNLVTAGSLKPEPCANAELAGLVHSGMARLADAKNAANSIESRFDLAYNAAHALALAALRWHGYRPANRYVVFQALAHTLNMPPAKWRVLSDAHSKRNAAEYEGKVDVAPSLLDALVRVADELSAGVAALGPIP